MLAHVKTMFHQARDHFMKADLDLRNCHFVRIWLTEYSFWTRWNLVEMRSKAPDNVILFQEAKSNASENHLRSTTEGLLKASSHRGEVGPHSRFTSGGEEGTVLGAHVQELAVYSPAGEGSFTCDSCPGAQLRRK